MRMGLTSRRLASLTISSTVFDRRYIDVMVNLFDPKKGFVRTGLGALDKAKVMGGEETNFVFHVLDTQKPVSQNSLSNQLRRTDQVKCGQHISPVSPALPRCAN